MLKHYKCWSITNVEAFLLNIFSEALGFQSFTCFRPLRRSCVPPGTRSWTPRCAASCIGASPPPSPPPHPASTRRGAARPASPQHPAHPCKSCLFSLISFAFPAYIFPRFFCPHYVLSVILNCSPIPLLYLVFLRFFPHFFSFLICFIFPSFMSFFPHFLFLYPLFLIFPLF